MEIINYLTGIFSLTDVDRKIKMPKVFRFLFCAIFTFLAYALFKALGQLSSKHIDLMLINILEPNWLALTSVAIILSSIGLWSSIIAIGFFNSLVPKIEK